MKRILILISLISILLACTTKTTETSTTDSVPSLDSVNSEPVTTDNPISDLYSSISLSFVEKDIASVKKLITENKADLLDFEKINAPFYYPGTFLFQFSDDADMVKFLLEQGFDPNIGTLFPGEEGSSRTEYPTTCERESAELLIEAGSQYAIDRLMKCAVTEKDVDQIRSLLKRKADPLPAIPLACELHDRDLLVELMENGASKNEALYWSVQHEDIELVKELLNQGARLGRSELNPWEMPSILSTPNEEIRSLVVDVTEGTIFSEIHEGEGICEGSYLISACTDGDVKTVAFMLQAGADPNQFCWGDSGDEGVNCSTTTALGAAESMGNEELIELLKKYGARKPENCM